MVILFIGVCGKFCSDWPSKIKVEDYFDLDLSFKGESSYTLVFASSMSPPTTVSTYLLLSHFLTHLRTGRGFNVVYWLSVQDFEPSLVSLKQFLELRENGLTTMKLGMELSEPTNLLLS